jgi:hypothetical protein
MDRRGFVGTWSAPNSIGIPFTIIPASIASGCDEEGVSTRQRRSQNNNFLFNSGKASLALVVKLKVYRSLREII